MTRDSFAMWSDAEPEDSAAAALFGRDASERRPLTCPPPDLLQASAAGVLGSPLQEQVAGHLGRCVVCQALAGALDDPSIGELTPEERTRIMSRVRSGIVTDGGHLRWRRWWPGMAAAAALIAVALGFSLLWQSRSVPPAQTAARASHDINLPNDPSVFVLDKAPTRIQGATALLWRGSPAGAEKEAFAAALEPYRVDDFAEAARRLRRFVERYPKSATGSFHLGVSELFLNRDAEAVVTLDRAARLAKGEPDLAGDVAWYLAYAYHRTGQSDLAARTLEPLCQSASPRASQACAGLKELSRRSR